VFILRTITRTIENRRWSVRSSENLQTFRLFQPPAQPCLVRKFGTDSATDNSGKAISFTVVAPNAWTGVPACPRCRAILSNSKPLILMKYGSEDVNRAVKWVGTRALRFSA
jgi:hypothetical protein